MPQWLRVPGLGAVLLALGLVAAACVTVDPDADPGATGNPAPSATSAASAAPVTSAAPSPADAAAASPEPTATPFARSDEPSLGFIALDGSLPFSQSVAASVRTAATAAGIALVECDAAFSREGAIACIDQLAEAGVHAVISFQPFADLAEDLCAAVPGAPVVGVVFDQGACEVSRLSIDQAGAGRLAGAAVGRLAQRRWDCEVNAYISLESNDADPDGRARMQGYRDGYQEHCQLPERQITLDDADRLVTAETQVADLLGRLRGRPNVVVGLNESAILGALAAVRRADRENQFWYSGQLADPAIREEIACNSRYIASVAQFPERFGEPLVNAALAALEGGAVPARMQGEYELVTADNVRVLFPDTPACDT
jgi:ribose transport system substrate-binding protein